MDKLKNTIRSKTRRTDGRSLQAICEDLNRTLRGWFGYFKHSKAKRFNSTFPSLAIRWGVRAPFSRNLKSVRQEAILGNQIIEKLPPIFEISLFEMSVEKALSVMRRPKL